MLGHPPNWFRLVFFLVLKWFRLVLGTGGVVSTGFFLVRDLFAGAGVVQKWFCLVRAAPELVSTGLVHTHAGDMWQKNGFDWFSEPDTKQFPQILKKSSR